MATRFEIVLHGSDPSALRAAGEEALDEIDRLEAQLSLYRPGSEVARLNAQAHERAVRVTPGLFRLIEQARALSQATQELWRRDLNENAIVLDLRRRLLLQAPHDEELFWHALAAEACDNSSSLTSLAREWIAGESAALRALGVSLLAAQGNSASRDHLTRLRDGDPSYWIREHAAWAWEVCSSEIACRHRYREILSSNSLNGAAAGLAEIRSALTPMAYAWHSQLDADFVSQMDRRLRGYLKLFWYHWGNTSSRKDNIEVCGRKLWQHCRGEHLKDGITSKMAPWWQIDDK